MPRLTVCLSFDFDAMSNWIGSLKTKSAPALSRGEFGAHSISRILSALRQRDVRCTFFVPGHTALAFPDAVRAISADGHEIGHHGWVHENPAELDPEEERTVIERGLAALAKVDVPEVRGYRSPGADFSATTPALLGEYGFLYDSSCSASDFHPYYLRTDDGVSTSEPFVFGPLTTLVEMPFAWNLDDFPLFEFVSGWSSAQRTPAEVRELWQAEFDFAYANADGGCFNLCMHPQVTGRGSRLAMLVEFIEYMQSRDGVEFSTMFEYADAWRLANPRDQWRLENPARVGSGAIGALEDLGDHRRGLA